MAGIAQWRRPKPHRQHRHRRDRFGLRLPLHRPDRLVRNAGLARRPDRAGRAGMARRRYRGPRVSVIAYGMVWDFFQYWFHRWQHTSPTLWPVAPRPSQRRQRQYHDGAAPQRARAFPDFRFHPGSDRDRGGRGRSRRTDRIRRLLWLGLLQPCQYPAAARTVDTGSPGCNGIACTTRSIRLAAIGISPPTFRSSISCSAPTALPARTSIPHGVTDLVVTGTRSATASCPAALRRT